MAELIDCNSMFSNGSEYEWFIEHNCESCKRFRNWQCAIVHELENARFDESLFPYEKLWDFAGGVAGKKCKHWTNEPIKRHRKNVKGQIKMDIENMVMESVLCDNVTEGR